MGRQTKHVRELLELADELGWELSHRRGRTSNHLVFTKKGRQPVFVGSTPSDHRAARNLTALLLRAERGAPT